MPRQSMPERVGEETICQDCLEREMGNWLDVETSEEFIEMANNSFSYMNHSGKCIICGRESIVMPEGFTSKMLFDCISEELEIHDAVDDIWESKGMLLN